MAKLMLAAPWTVYFRQLQALFAQDKDVRVLFDEDDATLRLLVADQTKAEALSRLLPEVKNFGGYRLRIDVVPGNDMRAPTGSVVRDAFAGNEAVSYVKDISGIASNDFTFVVFKPEIVQFYNDDLGDINGVCTTLRADIARSVFEFLGGVYFCTDLVDGEARLGNPLVK